MASSNGVLQNVQGVKVVEGVGKVFYPVFRIYGKTGIKYNGEIVRVDGRYSLSRAEDLVKKCNEVCFILPAISPTLILRFIEDMNG